MAKNATNGKRLNIAMAGLVVLIVSVASSKITEYANNKHETKDTVKAVSDLKTEGCLPARVNEKAIIRFESKVDSLESKVDTYRIEQRADTKEILEAIKDQ